MKKFGIVLVALGLLGLIVIGVASTPIVGGTFLLVLVAGSLLAEFGHRRSSHPSLGRYVVFVFTEREAEGGWYDVLTAGVQGGELLVRSFGSPGDAIREAEREFEQGWANTYHVVDLSTGQIVDKGAIW